jgi:hypothetical protein
MLQQRLDKIRIEKAVMHESAHLAQRPPIRLEL